MDKSTPEWPAATESPAVRHIAATPWLHGFGACTLVTYGCNNEGTPVEVTLHCAYRLRCPVVPHAILRREKSRGDCRAKVGVVAMTDTFWTDERIHEFERALYTHEAADEDVCWMWERLINTNAMDKARLLATWDSIDDVSMVTWEGEDTEKYSRFLGFLHDWKQRHSG
jgi:hypothetical protein